MEQHTHMLDTMMVKAGQYTTTEDVLEGDAISTASDQVQPAYELAIVFYGPEAERAKGNNEGNRYVPKREFFGLNAQDLAIGEQALGERMMARVRRGNDLPEFNL
jgi:hypothetical protein